MKTLRIQLLFLGPKLAASKNFGSAPCETELAMEYVQKDNRMFFHLIFVRFAQAAEKFCNYEFDGCNCLLDYKFNIYGKKKFVIRIMVFPLDDNFVFGDFFFFCRRQQKKTHPKKKILTNKRSYSSNETRIYL